MQGNARGGRADRRAAEGTSQDHHHRMSQRQHSTTPDVREAAKFVPEIDAAQSNETPNFAAS